MYFKRVTVNFKNTDFYVTKQMFICNIPSQNNTK